MRNDVCDGKIIAEEQVFEAERSEENQAARGHSSLPRALDQQRVAGENRRDSPDKRIRRTNKR
jgi:hypothetical protein